VTLGVSQNFLLTRCFWDLGVLQAKLMQQVLCYLRFLGGHPLHVFLGYIGGYDMLLALVALRVRRFFSYWGLLC